MRKALYYVMSLLVLAAARYMFRSGFKSLLWIGRKQRNEMDVAGGLIQLSLGKLSRAERRYVLNAAQLNDLADELQGLGVTLSAAAPGERTH